MSESFISSKPKNWETPFPTIGEVIRSVANILETKGNAPKDYDRLKDYDKLFDRLARGEFFDYEGIESLWSNAFNIPDELKFGKIEEILDNVRENLLAHYIGILQEGISFGYSRENIMDCFVKKIAHIIYHSINSIIGEKDDLLRDFISSNAPVSLAFKWKYFDEWEKFRINPPYGKGEEVEKLKDNIYRWMIGEQTPDMKDLFHVIKIFCDYLKMEEDSIYRVFFCAKIIHNVKQYSKISSELRDISNGKVLIKYDFYEPLEKTLNVSFDYKDFIEKNINRVGEYLNLYKKIRDELCRKTHNANDREKFNVQIKELEQMTRNLEDVRICWWNTQRLRAYWYILSGEWDNALKCYEEIIDIIFYVGEPNTTKIFHEAMVIAAINGDRILLKKLKQKGVVFELFGKPYTNRNNSQYSIANDESRTVNFIIEDSEVKQWASEFYNIFPKDSFFVSENELPKPVENPLFLNYIEEEMPKEADLKDKNKLIYLQSKKYPQIVWFAQQGNIEEIEKLLKVKADVNKLSSSGESALFFSIRNMDKTLQVLERNIKIFEVLSEYAHKKRTLEVLTNKKHLSILGSAVETGNPRIVKKVLEMMNKVNAEVNIKYGGDDVTPLYKTVQLFIEANKLKEKIQNSQSVLNDRTFEFMRRTNQFTAGITTEQTKQNYEQIMSNPYVKQGKKLSQEWLYKQYQEQYKKEHLLEIVSLLLEAKSKPNEPHNNPNGMLRGYTPLMLAAELNLVDVFDLLVKAGGNVENQCEYIHCETRKLKKADCWHIALYYKSNGILQYLEKNCKGDGKIIIL